MSNLFLNPTSLLHKTVIVEFEDERNNVFIQAVGEDYFEAIVNPGGGDDEFYAELYFSEWEEGVWKIVENID